MTMMTSREFNHGRSKAKKLAEHSPVVITDRGRPSHVLMSYEEYIKLAGQGKSIVELLGVDDDLDFDPPKLQDEDFGFQPVKFE